MACGDTIATTAVKSYFDKLESTLNGSFANRDFNQFIAPQFSMIRNSKYVEFRLQDVGNVTPSRLGIDDWKMISSRGMTSLESVGFRGCLYDNGKVWFEAINGQLYLKGFNHDMPWLSSEEIAEQRRGANDPNGTEK